MKKLTLLSLIAVGALSASAQSPALSDPKIEGLMKDIQAQQARIADNQAKIDAKLMTLAEAIRVAKIYASRGGR